jgi:flagellar FliJ protein
MHRLTDWSRLRELAQERRDATGARLAEAVVQRDTARQKLDMLVDYRRDYDGRLAQSATGGIDAEKLRTYRQFLANLERAIEQQSDLLALAEERVAKAQAQWRDEQRRVDSFRILDERQLADEVRRAGRHEQRLTDELASRLAAPAAAGGDD